MSTQGNLSNAIRAAIKAVGEAWSSQNSGRDYKTALFQRALRIAEISIDTTLAKQEKINKLRDIIFIANDLRKPEGSGK